MCLLLSFPLSSLIRIGDGGDSAADINRYAQQRIQQSIAECNSPASSSSPNSTLSRNTNASPNKRVLPTPTSAPGGGSLVAAATRGAAAQFAGTERGQNGGGPGGSGSGSNSSLEVAGVSVVTSSRLLLGSISRVLLLADRIVVKQLLATIHKVIMPMPFFRSRNTSVTVHCSLFTDLEFSFCLSSFVCVKVATSLAQLEQCASIGEFSREFASFGDSMVSLGYLSGDRLTVSTSNTLLRTSEYNTSTTTSTVYKV